MSLLLQLTTRRTYHEHFGWFQHDAFIGPMLTMRSSFAKTVAKEKRRRNDCVVGIYIEMSLDLFKDYTGYVAMRDKERERDGIDVGAICMS
jgi:hypothetical protein